MSPGPQGVWLVDKPPALTSHEAVQRARALLRTRQVGHAGTLDPMATGLLVLLVGEATKLSPFLSMERKRYQADICLGVSTDSLDADGVLVEETPVPEELRRELAQGRNSERLCRALEAERSRREQVPPAISAIHIAGDRAHARVRRGEEVNLPPRPVRVISLELLAVELLPRVVIRVELEVDKGYYVRSFGRDLGMALGVPAHLTALRRLASGGFTLAEATPLAPPPRLLSLEEVARRALPVGVLSEQGARRARQGQTLGPDDFLGAPPRGLAAWFEGERLLAVGESKEERFRVLRGFSAGRLSAGLPRLPSLAP
ncbi:MAG: tRNA pseudouridine(55) synthase TruB [Myxococcales bacterium]|nr:tRNA pseudouridine(55) synthase TruB [Polyangiaceae bacterium]MDW8250379.1 tRNA pseudouridine(55) synthase TruB [Myxococcales bacterium]